MLKALADEIFVEFPSDKDENYLSCYEEVFGPQRHAQHAIVEIGVKDGGSLLTFARYFDQARLVGIDLDPPSSALVERLGEADFDGRVRIETGAQEDADFVRSAVERHFGATPIDIVFDDASHLYRETRSSFEVLFERMRPGGCYVVEDWGCGYWESWPDGDPSGNAGLPRFIKEMIDDLAWWDRTHPVEPNEGEPVEPRSSRLRRMLVYPGIAILEKA